ncbi:MAG TPA: ABC transporter ATP-binding protein [Burkholderiales bacterium]|jgi:branched-chain amino acid transport system ATP-binding protein|nr:ABC transporter ATP-binding protein [Burkholderiales bacterium]
MSLLEIDRINSYYGDSHILFDVSMHVEENEVVALLGRNGAGKTTTLKTLAGVVAPRSGTIRLNGLPIHGLPPFRLARNGIQLVPEERRIIGGITVHENLQLAAMTADKPLTFDQIYQTFPRLAERRKNRGRQLSGGEQQMLAIARAMIRDARIILLDEPFEGLAPIIVHDLANVCYALAEQGRTIIIVEQNIVAALKMAHRCYILNNGHVVFDGKPDELHRAPDLMHRYLGVAV